MKLPDEAMYFPRVAVQVEEQARWTLVERNQAIPVEVWLIAAVYGVSLVLGARAAINLLS